MRLILVFILFITISCKKDKESKVKSKSLTKNIVHSAESTLICEKSNGDIQLYKEFIKLEEAKYKSELDGKLYYGSDKIYFDKLFSSKNIKCIVYLRDNEYNIFDIYYDSVLADNIFDHIVKINKNKDSDEVYNYHDFFKRGIVFVLNKKKNKITMITFNPFVNNKKPNEVKTIVSNSKLRFDKVIMTIGIGHIETLVN